MKGWDKFVTFLLNSSVLRIPTHHITDQATCSWKLTYVNSYKANFTSVQATSKTTMPNYQPLQRLTRVIVLDGLIEAVTRKRTRAAGHPAYGNGFGGLDVPDEQFLAKSRSVGELDS